MNNKLSPQTDAIFAPVRQLPKTAIMVNDETTYQTIVGLGSPLEHSTCYNITLLRPARQKKVLELQYRFDYYMYGHFMKYINRGAVRIDSTSSENLPNVAFRNPDGSIVLVVANPGRKKQKLSIGWKSLGLETELAAKSIATLVWKPSDL